jgi:hypothetical protein
MEDPIRFHDLLLALAPILGGLWLWALARVLRDLWRRDPAGRDLSRCGLPRRPLSPPPLARWLGGRRGRLPRGLAIR